MVRCLGVNGKGGNHSLNEQIYKFKRRFMPCASSLECTNERYSTVQYSTVQYSTVQYSTVRYNTVQYGAVQYSSTVLYSSVQYSRQVCIEYSTARRTTMI